MKDNKNDKKSSSLFSERARDNWNTFKRLRGKRRVLFVWDYYKLPIVLIVTLVLVVGIFAHMLWEGQKPHRLNVCVVLNNEEYCDQWFLKFEKELKKDGKSGAVEVNQDQPFDYDNQYYYLQELEVLTTISSGRMDVAICNADMYEYLLAINACLPLDENLPKDLYDTLSEKKMIDHNTANLQMDEYGNINEEDGIDGYYAINLDGTQFAEKYNQTEEDEPLYAVIISNTEHLEDSLTLIREITQ